MRTKGKYYNLSFKPARVLLTAALVAVFLLGCGYSLVRPPMASVKLGKIENRTYEPKLQDRFYEALSASLSENGIRISRASGHEIHGSINSLNLRITAEQDDVAAQYEVKVKGRFYLTGPDGESRELSGGGGEFIVSFSGQGDIEYVLSYRDKAVEEALKNISDALVDSIINDQ